MLQPYALQITSLSLTLYNTGMVELLLAFQNLTKSDWWWRVASNNDSHDFNTGVAWATGGEGR